MSHSATLPSPAKCTTVPASISPSLAYFSAKSAYLAAVAVAVITPAVKLPEPSRATIVLAVFALVAFDVTVNVAPSP
jgi:hypothetical protein